MKYRLTERGYEMEDGIVFTPYTQDNANAPASESKNDAPREMTAGDLGLDVEGAFWLQFSRKHGLPAIARWCPFDAPYAFWLGAEAA